MNTCGDIGRRSLVTELMPDLVSVCDTQMRGSDYQENIYARQTDFTDLNALIDLIELIERD